MATNAHSEYVNPYFFSTETMVTRERLCVMLHVHCPFWLVLNPHVTHYAQNAEIFCVIACGTNSKHCASKC